jgi:hypothetical protein
MQMKLLIKILAVIASVVLIGCGYKPTSTYIKKSIGELVYVKTIIDLQNPENSIIAKDVLIESIIRQTHATITDSPNNATAQIFIRFKRVEFTSIQKDNDGYDVTFQTKVTLVVKVKKNDKIDIYEIAGMDIYEIEPRSITAQINKQDSIKNASAKAINEFLSKVGL